MQEAMKAIAHNCRGLGNFLTVDSLLELQKADDPDILFLSKTKMDREGLSRLTLKLGMPNMVAKNCEGCSGGLALFWKNEVQLIVHPGMSLTELERIVIFESDASNLALALTSSNYDKSEIGVLVK